MEPIFELPLTIPPRRSRTRLRALHQQLRAAILEGRLRPGVRLPPTRALAASYGVSRNTAVAAYDLLLSEGYLSARRGAGTYVADILPKPTVRRHSVRSIGNDPRLNARWREPPPGDGEWLSSGARFDFSIGVPDIALFPWEIWRRLSARTLRTFSKKSAAYEDPHGRLALRHAIATHVSFTRAVSCSAQDVTITTGAHQAFDLLARILVTPGKTVVSMENPGYPPLRTPFIAAGAKITNTPVDNNGLIVERLASRTRIVCVTPSHQFPLGAVLSAARRSALLEFAQTHEAVLIEDDYDAEFRFGDRPIDALQTLDRSQSVFYVGTFSKSLFPSIRVGFIVAPTWARRALGAAKQCADGHPAVLTQETLAAFIQEGHLARHVRRARRIYGARRELLLKELHTGFSQWLDPVPAAAGLHLTALAHRSFNVEKFVEKAREREVGLYSLRRYQAGKPIQSGLVFGYGALDERSIKEGLARLRRIAKS